VSVTFYRIKPNAGNGEIDGRKEPMHQSYQPSVKHDANRPQCSKLLHKNAPHIRSLDAETKQSII